MTTTTAPTPVLEIEAGDLHASPVDRTITGLLLPYGETGRTNLGRLTVDADSHVSIPTDPTVVTLNDSHHRNRPVGRGRDLLATSAGVVATFDVARTAEGDELLAELADPTRTDARRRLSVEMADLVIRAGRVVRGRVYGAAVCVAGAFPSAALHAADAGALADVDPDNAAAALRVGCTCVTCQAIRTLLADPDPAHDAATEADPPEVPPATEVADGAQLEAQLTPDPGATAGTTPTTTTTLETPVTTTTAPAPAGTTPAAAPADLHASMGGTTAARAPLTVREVSRLMARAMQTRDTDLLARLASPEVAGPSDLFAALSDVKYDTAGSVGSHVNAQPAWLGELWSGRAYQRRILPLLGAVQPLTSLKVAGWRWVVKPEGGDWAGNKANVPSNAPSTEDAPTLAQRFAGAHDHAREFVDFPNAEYWESYWRAMTESYARWSDRKTLEALVAGATAVTAGAVPANVSPGMARIVDGALAIVERGLPTFAVVAPDLYRGLLLTRADDTLTYLNAALGLEDGTVQTFRIQPSAGLAAGSVLVGAREAATPYELPGAPVRVEALDMVRGGVDTGLMGYTATVIHDAEALALVGPPAP